MLIRRLLFVDLAQQATGQYLPADRHTEKAMAKGTRSIQGVPEKNHWRNKVD
ncbi:hypothetical protein [Spirosoma spitsbergense]|uniref:hypothetical protein n=1 Tax=Spirosoma spitsbergense TaxID=431554 RepID=UPI00037B2234|nr:hypothetical protein [Spirosoma spitsbergense]